MHYESVLGVEDITIDNRPGSLERTKSLDDSFLRSPMATDEQELN